MTEHEKINAINTTVREWFAENKAVNKVQAKALVPLFMEKGIFPANHRDGLPLRNLLRKLDSENRLVEIPYILTERKPSNTNWYFQRLTENFKGEEYPANIQSVVADMQLYIKSIDEQLNREEPFYIKDFIALKEGGKKKYRKNRDLFAQHFTFNTIVKKEVEIKGVYVLAEETQAGLQILNVGISRSIIRRLYQHTTGKKHNESTLGFYMAIAKHKEIEPMHDGKREQFPYELYRDVCLEDIRNLRFAIVPIDNNFELYMAEVYLACHYKAYWNTFETH